jgi:hypothetical protein
VPRALAIVCGLASFFQYWRQGRMFTTQTSLAQVGAPTTPPPDLPTYEQPMCPGDGYIWTPGYRAWGVVSRRRSPWWRAPVGVNNTGPASI